MFFTVNGRTYGQKPNGMLFPFHGEGFISLDRPTMQALKILVRYDRPTPQAEFQLMRDPNLGRLHLDAALRVWVLRKKTMQ